jgi:fructuronate reductase
VTQILHFGPGNFFRAHLADYAFDAGGWEITVVSLRSSSLTAGLARQGYAYTLAVMGEEPKRIDVIKGGLFAPEDPEAVLNKVASRDVEVISATVTEKGYHLGLDGALMLDAPDICNDLNNSAPQTLIGFLARGLAQRQAPVTVLSCDNRPGNGDALQRAVMDFALAAGLEITCKVTFPNAMVDRITPATTDALREATGDPMAVPCEPFKEWVLEDRFATERPNWPGVQWVNDVAPHELRKLRMLNGAHSFLAYAGCLAGHSFVHEAVADPAIRPKVRALMDEAASTLPEEVCDQASGYADALLIRFQNPHIAHRLRQIAMDGTQKLPYRIVETIRDRGPDKSPACLDALRKWIAFCRAETATGREIDDPKAEALAKADGTQDFMRLLDAEDLTVFVGE